MVRTMSGNQLPGLDPFVRVCIASGEEHERRLAAVPVGAGHGCSPHMGHGGLWDGGEGVRVDSASARGWPWDLAAWGIYTSGGSRLSPEG